MSFCAQDETVRFLMAQGETAGEPIVTHISVVVLTTERAYKLKRAVAFPYLDFRTPQARLAMCEREVALNRRVAPALYLAARRITRETCGGLAFDGAGELVDAVVEMRRFDEEALLDRLALGGRLTPAIVERLAARIAAFHEAAEIDRGRGGGAVMAAVLDLSETCSLARSRVVSAQEREALAAELRAAAARGAAELDRRRDNGKVRRCHGDLTLRNICLYDGEPTPFDCIEFSDDLAIIDILYDLAFLLMDLSRRKKNALAALALNRYLDFRDETDGLSLLPYFMALRAAIRADVAAARAADADADSAALDAETRDYFDLARGLLRPAAPRIVAIGGLSGTGKSSVAAALAPLIGAAPGARVLNSDRLRKTLCGVAPTARLPAEAYSADMSEKVYAALREEAARVARAGWSVIVDAVHARPGEREAIEAVAHGAGVPFAGMWLEIDAALAEQRVAARRNDVSDATLQVLEQQRRYEIGEMGWTRIDASRPVGEVVDAIEASLKARGPGARLDREPSGSRSTRLTE